MFFLTGGTCFPAVLFATLMCWRLCGVRRSTIFFLRCTTPSARGVDRDKQDLRRRRGGRGGVGYVLITGVIFGRVIFKPVCLCDERVSGVVFFDGLLAAEPGLPLSRKGQQSRSDGPRIGMPGHDPPLERTVGIRTVTNSRWSIMVCARPDNGTRWEHTVRSELW